ncbi:MAG: DUF2865 domain-containing protein [Xanthobacteraceae bacterium]|nr:DUF2865 domain-containing protein [Xanthobacteraceae bacterium]
MMHPRGVMLATVLIAMAMVVSRPDTVRAQDLLSGLFGALLGRPPAVAAPMPPLAYGGSEDEARPMTPAQPVITGTRGAFCVRSCDGRYFPVPPADGGSAAAACGSLCPGSATKVVYGGAIDSAVTPSGQSYADLPNAFRYRSEIVAGCTCNGKDTFGLAKVRIEDDHTLRKGDIVAGAGGFMVASGRVDGRKAANFTPAPASIRSRFERMPVLASE